MGILKKLSEFRRSIKEWDRDSVPSVLEDYANECVVLYREWFGPVPDPHFGIEIVMFPRSACVRDPLAKVYTLYFDKSIEREEEQFETIAHEVFHRVTWQTWVRHQLHLNEMLAFLVTQKALRAKGFRNHAHEIEQTIKSLEHVPSPASLRTAKRRGHLFAGSSYPDGFHSGVERMGLEFLTAFGWFHVTRMIRAKSLEDWLAELSPDKRNEALAITGYASP